MKVIFKEPFLDGREMNINNDLKTLQELVGGYIECMQLSKNLVAIFDEEGLLKCKNPNITLKNNLIVGNIIFCNADEEHFSDITEEQKKILENMFPIRE